MNESRLDGIVLDAAWDFDDPAGSEKRLRLLRDDVGATNPAGLEVTTQIARALGLQGRFEEGLVLLDEVIADDIIVRARVALERGRLLNSSGDPGSAIPWFKQGVHLAKDGGDEYLLVDGLHMLAIVDKDSAEDWTSKALTIATDATEPRVRRWVGALQNNLGWQLHDAGDLDGALRAFESALVAYEQTGSSMQVHIAQWSIARCLRSLGRIDESLAIQRRLKVHDEPDAFVDEEIAILESMVNRSGT